MKKQFALDSIEEAFNKAAKKGLISPNTAKTYYGRIENFINNQIQEEINKKGDKRLYNPGHWKGWMVGNWIKELAERYHQDDISATYIENTVHAFSKLKEIAKEGYLMNGKVKEVRIGEKGSAKDGTGHLGFLHAVGVIDSKEHVTSMKPKEGDFEKIIKGFENKIEELENQKDIHGLSKKEEIILHNQKTIVNVMKSQNDTGGRIDAELGLLVRDVKKEEYSSKTYTNDKNHFTHTKEIEEDSKEFYKEITDGKKDNTLIFTLKRPDGTDMSLTEAVLYTNNKVRDVARETGVNYITTITKTDENGNKKEVEVEMRYTTHSNRRDFAGREYRKTSQWSKETIKEKIANYLNLQGSNKEKILDRIDKERTRINYHRISAGKPERDFTWEEYRRLYVALLLAHSRIDVVTRYVDVQKQPTNKRYKN